MDAERDALLASLRESDDDMITPEPSLNFNSSSNGKVSSVHQQVNDVIGVMKENMQKVLVRDSNLVELQNRSESLSDRSEMFFQSSRRLQHEMWWHKFRMTLIVSLVIGVLLIIIIVPLSLN